MAVTEGFKDLVRDLLADFGPVTIRNMFGGAGIYAGGVMFAILDDDVLYLKTDETSARAFREEGMEGADAAVEDFGEVVADALAHRAGVAVARHKDEHRHEAVEAIAPRQDAHAGPLVELQDRLRELVERVLVDLE